VIEVHDTWFRVREDSYKRIDKNGMSESQEYEYSPNPEGATYTFTKRKNGRWVQKGCAMGKGTKVSVGVRRAWYDFSF
jgi:hypothetical protein